MDDRELDHRLRIIEEALTNILSLLVNSGNDKVVKSDGTKGFRTNDKDK